MIKHSFYWNQLAHILITVNIRGFQKRGLHSILQPEGAIRQARYFQLFITPQPCKRHAINNGSEVLQNRREAVPFDLMRAIDEVPSQILPHNSL